MDPLKAKNAFKITKIADSVLLGLFGNKLVMLTCSNYQCRLASAEGYSIFMGSLILKGQEYQLHYAEVLKEVLCTTPTTGQHSLS